VLLFGNTCRLPPGCTVPTLGSMVTLVALVTDQRKVDDSPRVMAAGVAAKLEITGFSGGGADSLAAGIGGGGGRAATFFLQADANSKVQNSSASNSNFRLVI